MNYIIIFDDSKKSDKYVICNQYEPDDFSFDGLPFGQRLSGNWREPTLIYDPKDGDIFSDWLFSKDHWLIASPKFIEKTAPYLESSVEYLDLTIKNSVTGECRNDYKIINILDILSDDVVDFQHSVYKDIMTFRMMIKYAFKAAKVEDRHIFMLESNRTYKFVSEDLVKVIKKNKLTGFIFQPVKTY